ncbi:serine hydrolase domain-containing protein [Lactovum odontotermitis]
MKSEYLDRVNSYLSQGIFQSCEFAVLHHNEEVDRHFLSCSSEFAAGSLWDLASVSKAVGVGTVLIDKILANEIDLDAALQSYYPAWHEPTVTIRQLLTHTSGIDPFIPDRDQLDAAGLTKAMNQLKVNSDKAFRYTDVNFILLGFMLEQLEGQSLAEIFQKRIFDRWQMTETSYGPVENAIPTVENRPAGIVHDPKARVLGVHCGSAGLFSCLSDLIRFVQSYFADEKYLRLLENFAESGSKARSLAWDLLPGGYLLHTGYTGTFVLMDLRAQSAVIFLSNRVYSLDERQKWLKDRDLLMADFQKSLTEV